MNSYLKAGEQDKEINKKKELKKITRQILNKNEKDVYQVIDTLFEVKPLYETVEYKQGWKDCLYVLNKQLRRLSVLNEKQILDQVFKRYDDNKNLKQ